MRISLVSTASAYPHTEALSRVCGLLLRRGDDVRVFTSEPVALSADLPAGHVRSATSANLQSDPYFATSELYIYHATVQNILLDSLLALDRGVVMLWAPTLDASGDSHRLFEQQVRLAAAADLVVCDEVASAEALQHTGAATLDRLHIVPPSVSLSDYSECPPDAFQRRKLGLLGKRVLLTVEASNAAAPPPNASAIVSAVRQAVDNAVLAIAPSPRTAQLAASAPATENGVIHLSPANDLHPYYNLAELFLADAARADSRHHALEALACGVPVLYLHGDAQAVTDAAIHLLTDDAAYGEAVRAARIAAQNHSLEAFAQAWGAAIARACDWLPVRMVQERSSASSISTAPDASTRKRTDTATASDIPVDTSFAIEQLKTMAGVALHDYEVRSPTPIFGPFIAWVRRNLTSHLRRPYIDPILDQQEAFNLSAVNTLENLARQLAATRHEHEQDRTTPPALDPQVYELLGQIDRLLVTLDDGSSSAQAAVVRSALAQLRDLLPTPPDGSGSSAEG